MRPEAAALPMFVLLALPCVGLAQSVASEEKNALMKEWGSTLRLGRELVQNRDDWRPLDQLVLPLFGRPLVVGGEIETEILLRTDFRLDPQRADDNLQVAPQLKLEFFYPLTKWAFVFLEGKFGYDTDAWTEDGLVPDSEWKIQRGQSWLHLNDLAESGFSLRVGRQNFQDEREWWWDADLDAARAFYEIGDFAFQVGIAHELAPYQANDKHIDDDLDHTTFFLGQATWYLNDRNRLELFLARRDDDSRKERVGERIPREREDPFDGDLRWAGLRSIGRVRPKAFDRALGRLDYWLDGAVVTGEETRIRYRNVRNRPDLSQVRDRATRDVYGWGIDAGFSYGPYERWPRVTVGYAYGSGDRDPAGEKDNSFRQTGLQNNNSKFQGVDSFKYYGELLRPELSNLRILTVAVGMPIPLLHNSSIELLWHRYWQNEPSTLLRNTHLKASPAGLNSDIGQEVDLVIGIEEWKHWEVELIGSWFQAGDAFGSQAGRDALQALVKINFNF